MITTKAAKCPQCSKYHFIATLEAFKRKEVREDFAKLLVDGFEVIETTTQDARNRFGFCPTEKNGSVQIQLF